MGHFGLGMEGLEKEQFCPVSSGPDFGFPHVAPGIIQASSDLTVSEDSDVGRHERQERHRSLVLQVSLHLSF